MRLVKLADFIDSRFAGKKPDRRTVLAAFQQDDLPAVALRRIGRQYFVDLDQVEDPEVDEVVRKVLDAA